MSLANASPGYLYRTILYVNETYKLRVNTYTAKIITHHFWLFRGRYTVVVNVSKQLKIKLSRFTVNFIKLSHQVLLGFVFILHNSYYLLGMKDFAAARVARVLGATDVHVNAIISSSRHK